VSRAGEMLDQPLLRQHPQRLPQRSPADAEVRAQLLLDDLLAGLQLAAQDRVTDAVRGDVNQHRRQLVPRPVLPWGGHGGPS
jgi:hypothetical protein